MHLQSKNFFIENIFSIDSEADLIRSFRLKDQKKLILPDGLSYPFKVRSYFTWKESSGVYTYLVFKLPNWDLPKSVVFKRTPSLGEPMGGLCSWCNSFGSSEDISLLSVAMSENVSNSYLICQDLRCIEKIEENCVRSGKDAEKYISDLYHKLEKLFENLSNYKPDA